MAPPQPLVSFDDASRRLRITGRSSAGVREIRVDWIVGSVGRSRDVSRDFSPHGPSPSRLQALRAAFPDGSLPAIDVLDIGGGYFVESVYLPAVQAARRASLPQLYASCTPPTATSSSGSTSSAGICGPGARTPTSTPLPATPGS